MKFRRILQNLLRPIPALLLLAGPALGQFDPFEDPLDTAAREADRLSAAEVVVDTATIAPGTPFTVALKITHPPEWHSYFHNDGIGISKVPTINWTLPEGFTTGGIQWPTPHRAEFVGLTTYGYFDTVYFSTEVTPPADLPVGEKVTLGFAAAWQTCKEACIDESLSVDITLPVGETAVPDPEIRATLEAYAMAHLPGPTPDGWTIEAGRTANDITLRVTTGAALPEDLFFYDYDAQIDPQAKQEWSSPEEGVWQVVVPRNAGNVISDTPGPVLDRLKGILAAGATLPGSGRSAAWVEAPFPDRDPAADGTTDGGAGVTTGAIPGGAENSLLKILGLAFLGGLILNLMPCVFPVLGLKVMGFVQQAGEDPGRVKRHGLVFTAGLLVTLWILAGILIALVVLGGQYLGWGFQLNDPRFLAVMILIFFVMGLNLSGLFEIGTSMTGVGGGLAQKKGYSGSFFSGILTTLVATPCTGPFLGVAMTFALQQPVHISFLVFTALGLGIASPYLVLSFSPKLLQKLPKPGPWMETFKKALAFPLYLAVVYFLNGFGAQTGRSGMVWLLTALVVIAIALWIYGNWAAPGRKPTVRRIGIVTALLVGALGLYTTSYAVQRMPDTAGERGTHLGNFEALPWEPGLVSKLRKQGHTVFVDYTADT